MFLWISVTVGTLCIWQLKLVSSTGSCNLHNTHMQSTCLLYVMCICETNEHIVVCICETNEHIVMCICETNEHIYSALSNVVNKNLMLTLWQQTLYVRVHNKVQAIHELRDYQKRQKPTVTGPWQVWTWIAQHSIVFMAEAVTEHADTLLSNCTILEQCAMIWFLWVEGVKPTDIHWRILAKYVTVNCMSHRSLWMGRNI
jgi:hypothetical protein